MRIYICMESKCLWIGSFWYVGKYNPIGFIYLFSLYFYFGCVIVFIFPRLLQHAMQCNATFLPVSCYFHIKSRVFYSQVYIFNTGEFKLHRVFVEAAQCKSFHLRRSNKLEKCLGKKREREDAIQKAKAGIYTQAGRISCTERGRQQTTYEKVLGAVDHQHDANSAVWGEKNQQSSSEIGTRMTPVLCSVWVRSRLGHWFVRGVWFFQENVLGEELQKQLEIWKTGFEKKGQNNSELFSTGKSRIEGEHVTVFKHLHDYKEEGNNLFSVAMVVRSDGLNSQQGVDLSETWRKYRGVDSKVLN